jgi:glycosyltransferase involved in cell wall biosynthesis
LIAKTGIVVPTLGTRPEYLEQALQSIRKAGNCFVLIVSPSSVNLSRYLDAKLADKVVADPGQGLAAAINHGLAQLPKEIHFVNWLGDDDQLIEHSIDKCENALERSNKATFVYGGCDYISESEKLLWTNKSGRWASLLLRFGPDLIPQPGALIRREALSSVGGLNTQYKLAFDLDLFLKLTKLGPGNFLGETLARFRWHENSLSVAQRREAVREASLIRIRHLPFWLRPISEIWEFPVRWLTLRAARIVERNLKGR